jgi:hypothetical protein
MFPGRPSVRPGKNNSPQNCPQPLGQEKILQKAVGKEEDRKKKIRKKEGNPCSNFQFFYFQLCALHPPDPANHVFAEKL